MKVECIERGLKHLTRGRIYSVLQSNGEKIQIINDNGSACYYFSYRFKRVPEAAIDRRAKIVGKSADIIVTDEIGWNPETRGPQMANPQARTIFKYQVPTLEQFELDLPQDAQLIRIAHIDGFTWAWAVVDLRKPLASRKFRAFKTGATIPDDFDTSAYVGFYLIYVQMELGLYVFEEK